MSKVYSFKEIIEAQKMPLDYKIEKAVKAIKQGFALSKSSVGVAFSGGKDSTVLWHLIRTHFPNVKYHVIFGNTTVEFPESLKFAKMLGDEWSNENVHFHEVLPDVLSQDGLKCEAQKEVLEWLVKKERIGEVLKKDGKLKSTTSLEKKATPEMWEEFRSRNLVWKEGTMKLFNWCVDQYGYPILGKAAGKLKARRINIDCFLRFSKSESENEETFEYYNLIRNVKTSNHSGGGTVKTYTKQHYIEKSNYLIGCIKNGVEHGIKEIIIDNFAGGGGASVGIEMATGQSVYAAINHDPEAIRMHMANHPYTKHYCESVWDVDPLEVCNGKPVGLAWFSPDCKHFSKAKGGKPKDKTIRGLAWVALRWVGLVRPRVIMLENVEEFKTWGPLNRSHRPIKAKKGFTFRKFIQQLEQLGYKVEYKELVAADYGTPTMRKRFFLVARCDGMPIAWPEPTHAPRDSREVLTGIKNPYVGAYTQLDFSLPCPSIFDSSEEIKEKYGIRAVRPLAEKTMQRIARGLQKFVLENKDPFIVQVNHSGSDWHYCKNAMEPLPVVTAKHGFGIVEPYIVPIGYSENKYQLPRVHNISDPLPTIVSSGKHYVCEPYMVQIGQTGFTSDRSKDIREPLSTIVSKNEHCLISPTLIQYHSETAKNEIRGQDLLGPVMTVDGTNRYGLVCTFIQKYFDGGYKGRGASISCPLPTITVVDHNSICATHLLQLNKNCDGRDIGDPIPTITAGYGHFGEVRAFLIKYYGNGTAEGLREPIDTITANDRFGLVTIHGVDYVIVDIGLRMLEPKELYGCQGFPDDYIIAKDLSGKAISRTEQVKRCGNAVCPPIPAALVKANLPELCVGERKPNMSIDDSQEQLRFV